MELFITLLIDSISTFVAMFCACKITDVTIDNKWLLIAVLGSAFISIIPSIGWVLSIIFLFWVLNQFSNAKIWPDLVIMVVISRLITVFFVLPIVL